MSAVTPVPENLIRLAFHLADALEECGIDALDYGDKINVAAILHRDGVGAPK